MFRPTLNFIFNVDRHPLAIKWDAQAPTPKLLASLQAYRWRLDDMQAQVVIWMPYGVDVLGKYLISSYHGCIFYGSIIEPHMPDRVLLQFGYVQTRPMTPIKLNKEYKPENSYSKNNDHDPDPDPDHNHDHDHDPRPHLLTVVDCPWLVIGECESTIVLGGLPRARPEQLEKDCS
ncbi:Serine/threonine-protein phosphatase 7 long form-like protein [Bienertia sinuspersici]